MRRLVRYIIARKDAPAYESSWSSHEPEWCARTTIHINAVLMRDAEMEISSSLYTDGIPVMIVKIRHRDKLLSMGGINPIIIVRGYTLHNYTAFFLRGLSSSEFIEIIYTGTMKERPLRKYFKKVLPELDITLYCVHRKHYASDLINARLGAIAIMS